MENKFNKYLGSLKVPFIKRTDEVWNEIYERTIGINDGNDLIISLPFYKKKSFWVGAAASLALLVSVGYLLNLSTPVELTSHSGEMRSVDLPDGSHVMLNAHSVLSYDADSWDDSRVVSLLGEAFFDVEKGSPFIVQTENGSVEVLGTSFNVFSRATDFNVSCKTGKVKVSNQSESVVLTPGLCTYTKKGVLVDPDPYNKELIGVWQQREYYHFENVPLQNVFNELGRQFSVTFELNEIPTNIVVNADINIQELEKALDIVCATYDLSADKSKNSVYKISKK